MRLVIQRVSRASVSISGQINAEIARGLLILVGIEEADGPDDVEWLATKVAKMRLFADEAGLINLSVKDIDGGLLVVSQFTLHASTRKGNRPSFIRAARPDHARSLYEDFIKALKREAEREIATGVFAADMQVELVNDGPVTIWVDSRQRE